SMAPEKDPFTDEITGYVFRQRRITADAEYKDVVNNQNGFADIHLMGIVPPDEDDEYLHKYAVTNLEFEYTPEKKWEDSYTREIDYTIKYGLEVFHGDTVSDLTKKNFRFRRTLEQPSDGEVEFLSRIDNYGVFTFAITMEAYLLLSNTDDFVIRYD